MKEIPTAAMDTKTKISTVIFILLLPAIFIVAYFFGDETKTSVLYFRIISLILLASFGAAYLLRPKYFISQNEVVIKTYFKEIKFPINEIQGMRKDDRSWTNFRTFGVGGIFGHFGYFNGNELWYVTNLRKKVKIKNSKKIYVVSPEDPENFINQINDFRRNFNFQNSNNIISE